MTHKNILVIQTAFIGDAILASSVLEKLHADLLKVLQMPDVVQRFTEMVVEPAPQSRDEFTAFMRAEAARWAKVVKDAGIPTQ